MGLAAVLEVGGGWWSMRPRGFVPENPMVKGVLGLASETPTLPLDDVPGAGSPADVANPSSTLRDGPSQPTETLDSLRARVKQQEHAANVLRMRKLALTGVVLWPVFFVTDWLM